MDKLKEAERVFNIEIRALEKTRDALDETFVQILDAITDCRGKVIVTGMGKPGHIATKLAATFSSLGTPSFFLHPAEAMHGDLGMISRDDIVVAMSYSGESEEVIRILPVVQMIGAKLIAITGNPNSTLARIADIVQVLPAFDEACYLGLAPTSSTTAELVYGDALAVVASAVYGFKDADFGRIHPAGSLGKKLLLKVKDIMITGEENAVVNENAFLKDAIIEISKKEIGMTSVVDKDGKLVGIITSGDIRRAIERFQKINGVKVEEVLKREPICCGPDDMAFNALKRMVEIDITYMPVVDDGKLLGVVKIKDILKSGIVATGF